MSDQINELIQAAIEAREKAYAPYSKFFVGAAVMTKQGKVFTGCNCENGVFGLSICAERVAITKAVSSGHRQFETLAIAAHPLAPPCGSCRQFMAEFGNDLNVVSCDAADSSIQKQWTISELLPNSFRFPKE